MTKLLMRFRHFSVVKLRGGKLPSVCAACCWLYRKAVTCGLVVVVSLWLFACCDNAFYADVHFRAPVRHCVQQHQAYCMAVNARHLPLVPQGFRFIIPGSARHSARSDVSAFPDQLRSACAFASSRSLLAFLFAKFVQLLADHYSVWRKKTASGVFCARDFPAVSPIFSSSVSSAHYQHPIPMPASPHRRRHSMLFSIQPRLSCASLPSSLFISSEYADMAFSRHQPLFPCSPSA